LSIVRGCGFQQVAPLFGAFWQIVERASRFGNHGTPFGGIRYANGKVGAQALSTDGTNGYVQIPVPTTGDFTIAFWAKTADVGPTGLWFQGKGFVDGDTPGPNADFGTALVVNKFAFGVGNPNTTITSTNSANDGTWQYLGVTRNSSIGAMILYVNGVPQASTTGPTDPRTTPTTLRIGGVQTCGATSYLRASLDDLRFHNSVLSAAQIQALPGFAPPPPVQISATVSGGNLVLSWPGSASNYVAFATTNLAPPVAWTLVTNAPQSSNRVFYLTLPMNSAQQFFRLSSQ
jgi:hypothetical protein